MEVMAQGNRHIVDSDSKVDNNVVRQKVMDSYQDMLSGKGRDYKVFFAEEGADKILDYYRASKGAFLCIQKNKRILHYGYIIKQSL